MAELEIVVYPDSPPTHYHLLDLAAAEDGRLSLQAVGLHTYLVSRPPGWKIWEKALISNFRNGRDSIRSAMRELEEFGYIEKEQTREKGQFSSVKLKVHRRLKNRRRENRRRKTRRHNNKQYNSKQKKDVSKETSEGFRGKPFGSENKLLTVKIKRRLNKNNGNGLLYNSASAKKRGNGGSIWKDYDLDTTHLYEGQIAKLKDKIINRRINKPLVDETNEVLNYWNECVSLLSNNGCKLTKHSTDRDTATYYKHKVIVTGVLKINGYNVEDLKKAIDNYIWILQNSWYGRKNIYRNFWEFYGNQRLFGDCIEGNVKTNRKYVGRVVEQREYSEDELIDKLTEEYRRRNYRENPDSTVIGIWKHWIKDGTIKTEEDLHKAF